MSNLVSNVTFVEDSSCVLMARITDRTTIYGTNPTPLVQADFSSIILTVYDVTLSAIATGFDGISLTISSVIYDSLQGWGRDNIGHNFRYTLAYNAFVVGSDNYSVEVKYTLTNGRIGHCIWRGPAIPLYRS